MRATGQEVQCRNGFVIRLVRIKARNAVRGIGIEGFDLPWQDYVVADPNRIKREIFVPIIIYGVYKHMKSQTPGKMLLRIEVVNGDGQQISFWRGLEGRT